MHDVGDAETLLRKIDEHRSEMDAREEGFNKVMEAGERMIDNGHFATDEASFSFFFPIVMILSKTKSSENNVKFIFHKLRSNCVYEVATGLVGISVQCFKPLFRHQNLDTPS